MEEEQHSLFLGCVQNGGRAAACTRGKQREKLFGAWQPTFNLPLVHLQGEAVCLVDVGQILKRLKGNDSERGREKNRKKPLVCYSELSFMKVHSSKVSI
jgi:hypothetical protein